MGGFWLGYHDHSKEGKFETVDGSIMKFTDWGAGEPNDYGGNEDCASLRADSSKKSGKWNDTPCHRSLSFICKKNTNPRTTVPVTRPTTPTVTTPLTTTPYVPSNRSCLDGWSRIDGSNACYQVNIEPVTFYDAYLKCLKKQARLTDIPERLSQAFTEYLRADSSISGQNWAAHDGLLTAGALRYGGKPGSNTKPSWSWWLYKSRWNPQWNSKLRQDLSSQREYCSMISLQRDNFGNLVDFPCVVSYARGYVCKKDEVDVECEDGWYMDVRSKACYKISDDRKSWPDANTFCAKEYNARLASLKNKDDTNFLAVLLRNMNEIWIGAHDQFDEGTWEWVDRTPWSSDLQWALGQPDNWRSDEHCGMLVIRTDMPELRLLNDGTCSHAFRYICKKMATKITDKEEVTTESSSSQVPSSSRTTPQTVLYSSTSSVAVTTTEADGEPKWLTYNDQYLHYSPELVTWAVARQNCLDKGGDLINFQSERETLISVAIINQHNNNTLAKGVWIGLNSLEKTGRWLWSDKGPVSFIQWKEGRPLNQDGLQCASIINDLGIWTDNSCLDEKPYMCGRRYWNVSEPDISQSSGVECPGHNWRRYGDSCYLFMESGSRSKTWSEAVQDCSDQKAHLVTISNYFEQSFIYSFLPHDSYCSNLHTNDTQCNIWAETGECDQNPVWMAKHCHKACKLCMHYCRDRYKSPAKCAEWMRNGECSKNPKWMIPNCAEACGVCLGAPTRGFWIGLKTDGFPDAYKWHNYDSVSFTNWDVNQPVSNGRKPSCAAMFLSTGMWNTGQCEARLPGYVCERPADVPSTGSTTPSSECIHYIEGDCVQVHGPLSTYQETVQWCNSLGGHIPLFEQFSLIVVLGRSTFGLWLDAGLNNTASDCHVVKPSLVRPVTFEKVPCNTNNIAACITPASPTPQPTGDSTLPTTTEAVSCSPDWHLFENHCYMVRGEVAIETEQWHDAKRHCEMMGAFLVSLHSEEEANFVLNLLHEQMMYDVYIWIGLHTSSYDRNFEWVDDTVLDYTNWVDPEPNNFGGSEDCVEMSPSTTWNDVSCYSAKPFVCKVPRGKAVLTPHPPTVYENCEGDFANWFRYNDSCYMVEENDYTWKDAEDRCRTYGAHLASLHSDEETHFLLGLMPKLGHIWMEPWIGFNDITLKRQWTWSDGSPQNYVQWHPGNPDSEYYSEQCASLTIIGRFRDDGCQTKRSSVCKINTGSNVTANTTAPVTDNVPKGCPPDFYAFGERCFYIGQEKLNFSAATAACYEKSGVLASIHSQKEQDFIYEQAISVMSITDQDLTFWIGLQSLGQYEHGFYWMDNSDIDFTYWEEEPFVFDYYYYTDDSSGAYIQENGFWRMADRSTLLSYICSRYKSPDYAGVTTTVDPRRQCPPNYGNLGYTCLRLVTSLQSWDKSRAICKQDGGDLATIENNVELISQVKLALANTSLPVWFGGQLKLATGFQWITGGRLYVTIPWQNSVSDGYMYYEPDGKFNTGDKATNKAALCIIRNEKPNRGISTPPTSSTTTSAPLDCRKGALYFRGYCYIVEVNEKKEFADAIMACARYGMILASIHNQLENQALTTYARRKHGMAEMYIGLLKHRNTPIMWLDRSPMNYNPNILGTDDNPCVVLSSLDEQWYHMPCKQRFGYICKGKPDVPLTTQRTRETTSRGTPSPSGNNDTSVQEKIQSTALEDTSLTGGEVAGIIIGVCCVIVLVLVGLYMLRSMMLKKTKYPVEQQSLGFDNALFQKHNDAVNLD